MLQHCERATAGRRGCTELWTLSIRVAEELNGQETPAWVGDRMTKVVIGCAEKHLLPSGAECPAQGFCSCLLLHKELEYMHRHVYGEDAGCWKASITYPYPLRNLSVPSLACYNIPALSATLWLNVTSAFGDNR